MGEDSQLALSQSSTRFLPRIPLGSHHTTNIVQFTPPKLPIDCRPKNPWLTQSDAFRCPSLFFPNLSKTQLPRCNPSHLWQQGRYGSTTAHFSPMQSQFFNQQSHVSHLTKNLNGMLQLSDKRDQRTNSSQGGRPNLCNDQLASDTCSQKSDNGWPQLHSKYMSTEEIDCVLRNHRAGTMNNDPYLEDYYHLACLAKKSAGLQLKHQFFPASLRDLSFQSRATNEPHAYLQVEALGRISFSSIHRPRPLLQIDPPSASGNTNYEQKTSNNAVEQEPLLTARVAIEDGLCLLLDVDDIDRLLQFSQPQDGGSQMRRRRQSLLEELATLLHLFDPLGTGEGGHPFGFDAKDDLIFLRLVSLPKGQKLLSRYLNLLLPESELAQRASMAVFRHLRILFDGLSSDSSLTGTTKGLATAVSLSVRRMDLNALSACLAAVACSPEQPPLRPLGSSAGDGATIIIKSLLERATYLLTAPHSTSRFSMQNRVLWQASFDSFFTLLVKYCLSKYETVMELLVQEQNTSVVGVKGLEAAKMMSREMPVDLLRASLPHTNESQRKLLLDFSQRSMPMAADRINSESVDD